jgi:hypothetical protein
MAMILEAAINGARMPSEHPRLPIHPEVAAMEGVLRRLHYGRRDDRLRMQRQGIGHDRRGAPDGRWRRAGDSLSDRS